MLTRSNRARREKQAGFTIVELLIVIVVIAILAAITIVAYNGIQTRARNTIRQDELTKWGKLFAAYKALNGTYPASMVTNQEYCLGTGYPVGYGGIPRCHSYQIASPSSVESDNSTVMADLKTVGSLPTGDRTPLAGLVGPYVSVGSTGILVLTMAYEGTVCPAGTNQFWTDGVSRATCTIQLQ